MFELARLGFFIPRNTVARYLHRTPEYKPRLEIFRDLWRNFLGEKRRKITAMDFFQIGFFAMRKMYVFFIIEHDRRLILHWNITFHPTEDWVCRQLSGAFDLNDKYKYLICDRDSIFSAKVRNHAQNLGLKVKRISPRSPWQNGVAERWVKTVKTELFYRKTFWNVSNSRRLLKEYVHFYNHFRPHRTLDGDSPQGRPIQNKPSSTARVVSVKHCDNLHTHYEWRDSA